VARDKVSVGGEWGVLEMQTGLIGVSVAAEVHNPEVTEDIEPMDNDDTVLEINFDTASVHNGV